MTDDTMKELKRLRRDWRREATRLSKSSAETDVSASYKERCYGEANIYAICANRLDALIRKAKADD